MSCFYQSDVKKDYGQAVDGFKDGQQVSLAREAVWGLYKIAININIFIHDWKPGNNAGIPSL